MTEACHHAVAAAQHFQSTLLLKYRRTIAARRLTHVNAKIAKSVVFYFGGSSWSEAFHMREAAMKSAIVQVSPKILAAMEAAGGAVVTRSAWDLLQ